jgi:hypothetical protein
VIAWRKYGMGLVGAVAISPTEEGFQGTNAYAEYWKYIFSHTSRPADISLLGTDSARETVNMLNGLTIPGPDVILNYTLLLLALVVLTFGIMFKLKKMVLAWPIVLIISLVMTALIFKRAYSASDGTTTRTAAVFSQIAVSEDSPAVKVYSIFSRNDEELEFDGEMTGDRFRHLPKIREIDRSSFEEKGAYKTGQLPEVITGFYTGQDSGLTGLMVQGLSARVFMRNTVTHNTDHESGELKWAKDGLTVTFKDVPSELKQAEHIYLAGVSGVIVLSRAGKVLSKEKAQAPRGQIDRNLRDLLASMNLKQPILAYAIKNIKDDDLLNDAYTINGMSLFMAPVKELLSGEVYLPGEFSAIDPTSSSLFIYRDGEWLATRHMGGKEGVYDFHAKPPLGFEDIEVEELVVDFEIANQSGNILTEITLNGQKGTRGKDGLFRFPVNKNEPNKSFKITIHTNAKVQLTDNLEIFKANSWSVKHLRIGYIGKFGKQHKELRF